ncbi:hypothetical protein VTN96DRAFT_4398 [Rasamsonia emersonii]
MGDNGNNGRNGQSSAAPATRATRASATAIPSPSHTGIRSLPKGEDELPLGLQVSTIGGRAVSVSVCGLQGSAPRDGPVRVKGKASKKNPPSAPPQSAGPRTRSAHCELVSAFEWEALDIAKRKLLHLSATGQAHSAFASVGKEAAVMSRNRPRGPPTSRDNGLAANEETDMWNKIIQDLRKAKEKNDKQRALSEQIASLNEKIAREGNRPTLSEYNQLDSWYRQLLKLSEEEKAILQEEPCDVIKNLGLLTALRSASEAEAPLSRAASIPKSNKLNRVKGSTQRSSSVSSAHTRDGRDGVSVKVEEGAEGAKGTPAERSGQFFIGAEVVFKHNKNKQGVEGEGIQCIIKGISGEGHKKRYDVQDPEPNENGEQGAVYRTTAASLIPIPQPGAPLPSFPVGKQVLARYPDTTTFYRAEVMGSKKDVYRLKFEGEEDDKEMEVDKRFVLDIPGK